MSSSVNLNRSLHHQNFPHNGSPNLDTGFINTLAKNLFENVQQLDSRQQKLLKELFLSRTIAFDLFVEKINNTCQSKDTKKELVQYIRAYQSCYEQRESLARKQLLENEKLRSKIEDVLNDCFQTLTKSQQEKPSIKIIIAKKIFHTTKFIFYDVLVKKTIKLTIYSTTLIAKSIFKQFLQRN